MNSGELGQEKQTARELTEEIDRATNVVSLQERQAQSLDRGQAGNLGNRVLTYNPEVNKAELENERVREMAEIGNGLKGNAEGNVSLVGMESALLIDEREELSRENLLNELDPKRDHEAEIMAKDQTGVAKEMMAKVETMTRGNFRIMDLEVAMSKGRDRMLESFENPRRLGDRN